MARSWISRSRTTTTIIERAVRHACRTPSAAKASKGSIALTTSAPQRRGPHPTALGLGKRHACWSASRRCTRNRSTCRSGASSVCSRRSAIRERRLPPVVHVAGTNGKGSLIAFVRAIAEALGQAASMSTPRRTSSTSTSASCSPAPMAPRRSPRTGWSTASPAPRRANAGELITFFEITTAAALPRLRRDASRSRCCSRPGLGGRPRRDQLSSSSRLPPRITPISHRSRLLSRRHPAGDRRARRPASSKPGVPCIVGRQEPEALQRASKRGPRRSARRSTSLGRDFDVFGAAPTDLDLPDRVAAGSTFRCRALNGRHQIDNAGAAHRHRQRRFRRCAHRRRRWSMD